MARLSIDSIARETANEVRAHFTAFATLTAAFVFLPGLIFALAVPPSMRDFHMPAPGTMPTLPGWFWAAALAAILLQSLVTLTIAAIAGDPARVPHETVGQTLTRMLPALLRYLGALVVLFVAYLLLLIPVTLILVAVTVAFGAVGGKAITSNPQLFVVLIALLLLPALLWLGARLSPMVGVFAAEGSGPVSGIRRAWRLSRGAGWRIALLIVLTSLAAILVALVASGITGAIGSLVALGGAIGAARLLVTIASGVANGLLFILFSAGLGVIYRQLRAAPPVTS